MQRLGKNNGGYLGDTIDIQSVYTDIEAAAHRHGWTQEFFYHSDEFKLFALHRPAPSSIRHPQSSSVYISAGIHGDEPASPLAALRLLQENKWPEHLNLWLCPCLNPVGFRLNRRANAKGLDLNREYLKPTAEETIAHIAWLEKQPRFDLCLMLHEDWESQGFYLYEQNPDKHPSLAEPMVEAVAKVCPVDPSPIIEGRPAQGGIIRPNLDPKSRPDWPEAFYLITHKTRMSYTLEAPSDFIVSTRVDALVAAVNAAVEKLRD